MEDLEGNFVCTDVESWRKETGAKPACYLNERLASPSYIFFDLSSTNLQPNVVRRLYLKSTTSYDKSQTSQPQPILLQVSTQLDHLSDRCANCDPAMDNKARHIAPASQAEFVDKQIARLAEMAEFEGGIRELAKALRKICACGKGRSDKMLVILGGYFATELQDVEKLLTTADIEQLVRSLEPGSGSSEFNHFATDIGKIAILEVFLAYRAGLPELVKAYERTRRRVGAWDSFTLEAFKRLVNEGRQDGNMNQWNEDSTADLDERAQDYIEVLNSLKDALVQAYGDDRQWDHIMDTVIPIASEEKQFSKDLQDCFDRCLARKGSKQRDLQNSVQAATKAYKLILSNHAQSLHGYRHRIYAMYCKVHEMLDLRICHPPDYKMSEVSVNGESGEGDYDDLETPSLPKIKQSSRRGSRSTNPLSKKATQKPKKDVTMSEEGGEDEEDQYDDPETPSPPPIKHSSRKRSRSTKAGSKKDTQKAKKHATASKCCIIYPLCGPC